MLLKELSEARGVSGNEDAVRQIILDAVKEQVDEHRVDALGNLICLRKARRPRAADIWPHKVMLAAHMDEIGLIVTGINSDGTLRFDRVGTPDQRTLLSKQVLVGEKAVPGVIGYRPIHLISAAERENVADMSHATIDIGAESRSGAEKLAQPGDYVTFRTAYEILDAEGLRTVKGKALDDRVGCAVLIELLREDYAMDLYAVFTTQEEVGTRGATVAAWSVAPDVAIGFDGTICDDLPKKKDTSPVTVVGQGPVITFRDASFIADPRLVRLLTHTAERLGIPCQSKRAVAGGTDAHAIHLSREGVPSAMVSVPVRYIHAPVSLLSLVDAENTVRLAREALHTLEGGLES